MASSRQSWFESPATKKKEETEELLVFGYSCKLFRDDEKALFIDQGKHLIPWMGDETLKIDRYDVRGTVYDLRSLEPIGGGASEALWSTLSDAERKVEQLCDEERYRALYHNEAEEALYQEEELKRLHQALDPQNSYGQVAYSYDSEGNVDKSDSAECRDLSEQGDEEDEPFIPPQELDIPVGMVLPERTKLNAIIEKTALFINTQGPQMEILLKMKQANNPQFSFLSYDCPLHTYYRHLLMAIKTGRYQPKRKQLQQEQESETNDHYLHPSLAAASSRVELAPNIPSISYKPSADCAYSMLVSKIKDKHHKPAEDSSGHTVTGDVSGPRTSLREECQGSEGNSSNRLDQSISSPAELATSSIPTPTGELKLIIDKMASYVIKNGRDFELVVRSKRDERFSFLEKGHEFHPYYEHKVRVYQSLEATPSPPQPVHVTTSQSVMKKKKEKVKTPVKKQQCILLPGYEYSDDDSESDDESQKHGTSGSKPKLAPVSFSIKKPKESEILKEVRSALPVEEESSEDEVDADNSQVLKPPGTSVETEAKSALSECEQALPKFMSHIVCNAGEEMEKLQKMLKEKEQQLREMERQKKLSEKLKEDIFLIEKKDTLSELVPIIHAPIEKKDVCVDRESIEVKETDLKAHSIEKYTDELIKDNLFIENSDSMETSGVLHEKKDNDILFNRSLEDEVIAEAEIIDLTDDTNDVPKISDTTRLERKRKAAAFLNLIKKDQTHSENGAATVASDSDGSSKQSTPSPPSQLMRYKKSQAYLNYNGASVPRTSLMARLTASSALKNQPSGKKKNEECPRNRGSSSPVKSTWEKGKKTCSSLLKKHKRKRRSSSESEDASSSLSRSRSVVHSRSSPHKRRPSEDCDSEHRGHRMQKDERHKMAHHRRKHSEMEVITSHSHHKKHKDNRHFHGYNQSYNKISKETKANSSDSSD